MLQTWQYLTYWANVQPPLNGNDLKGLGYQPGPQYRQILDDLLAAMLDGAINAGGASPREIRAAAEAFVTARYPR